MEAARESLIAPVAEPGNVGKMRETPSFKTVQAVVVTGGSSGIGAALIRTLRKIDSVRFIGNLSRSEPDEFLQDPRCQHYRCDLSDAAGTGKVLGRLRADLESHADGPVLLINNSGFGSYGSFQELSVDQELNMIDLNVRSLVEVTGRLLPLLIARGGWIVNLSSLAGCQPTPFMATYGASKAFVLQWTLALRQDLRGCGVDALAICPGPTESNFFRRAGFDEAPVPGQGHTAEQVAEEIVRAVRCRRSLCVPGLRNRLLAGASSKLPRTWQAPIARFVLKRFRLDRLKPAGESGG